MGVCLEAQRLLREQAESKMEAAAAGWSGDVEQAHRESKPLLEWRDVTPVIPQPPLKRFEIGTPSAVFWMKADLQEDGGWWVHFQCVPGCFLPSGISPASAKAAAVQWAVEKLERVLAELKRGVA